MAATALAVPPGGYPYNGESSLGRLITAPSPVAVMGGETHCTGTRRPEVT